MNRLITSLILMACLLTPHLTARAAPRVGQSKAPAADEQKAREELILGLRNMLYADQSLDEALEALVGEDDPVGGAVVHLRAKDYARALATLEKLKGRGESMSYWLALAAAYRGQGKLEEARAAARHLASDAESRVAANGWAVLRELGGAPGPKQADEVLGVVVEMAFDEGVAIIAGYADGGARFFMTTGAGYIGEGLPEPVRKAARALTQAAAPAVPKLDPGARRALPARGTVRVTVLTPAGLRVADVADDRIEAASHPLSGPYHAAHVLFLELKKVYDQQK